MKDDLRLTKEASYELLKLSTDTKNKVLCDCADVLIKNKASLLSANSIDLENARRANISEGLYDRLKLTEERIRGMADGLRKLASLPDPLSEISDVKIRPNGLKIARKRVPMGVVGIIYEARPNVGVDAFGIAFKSGNAVVLRGGSDAINSSKEIVKLLKKVLQANNINENTITYIEDTRHESIKDLITATEYVDLIIPRGGAGLIDFVVKNATVPSIHTGTGNCHIYVDEFADLDMAINIIVNAKTTRLGVCNACESLVVHKNIIEKFSPMLNEALKPHKITIRADEISRKHCKDFTCATEDDWGTEYLDRIISLKCVKDIDEAVSHINRYNTGHTESIITENIHNAEYFLDFVDSACVYVNASTRFTDGGEFGFGAEIGISTQKLHARGPMGLRELTCEKYIIIGNGQTRN